VIFGGKGQHTWLFLAKLIIRFINGGRRKWVTPILIMEGGLRDCFFYLITSVKLASGSIRPRISFRKENLHAAWRASRKHRKL